MTIAFASHSSKPALYPSDNLVALALKNSGTDVVTLSWDRGETTDMPIVIRSSSEHHLDPHAFETWMLQQAGRSVVINSAATILAHVDKQYLADMESAGEPVIPTRRIAPQERVSVLWQDIVIKPAIGGSARGVVRTTGDRLQELVDGSDEALIIQPYCDGVMEGELSLVYFTGEYSHAVLKMPPPESFIANKSKGARVTACEPEAAALMCAERCARDVLHEAIVRIDLVKHEGAWLLMEKEVIDPAIFADIVPSAAERCAAAIMTEVGLAERERERTIGP